MESGEGIKVYHEHAPSLEGHSRVIDQWFICMKTIDGQYIELDDVHYTICKRIDDLIEADYPVTWLDEENDIDEGERK